VFHTICIKNLIVQCGVTQMPL